MAKRLILRVDDICAYTRADDLLRLYGAWWAHRLPICFSVVPCSAYRFETEGPVSAAPLEVGANPGLVELLAEQARAGLVEIALHGWMHHHGELAQGGETVIRQRIESGLRLLHTVWPGVPVRVAVPPHDFVSPAGLRAIRAAGLGICSSWAAVHGGTRRAHGWGRLRRWYGRPFGRAGRGRWSTDITLLDGRPANWPQTRRLLVRGAQLNTPVVFVQHPWRLLADDSGFRCWQEHLLSEPGIRVERFSDG